MLLTCSAVADNMQPLLALKTFCFISWTPQGKVLGFIDLENIDFLDS